MVTSGTEAGMVMDFRDLNTIVKAVAIEKYDHQDLNSLFVNPTAEIVAQKISEDIQYALPDPYLVERVALYETDNSYAEVIR